MDSKDFKEHLTHAFDYASKVETRPYIEPHNCVIIGVAMPKNKRKGYTADAIATAHDEQTGSAGAAEGGAPMMTPPAKKKKKKKKKKPPKTRPPTSGYRTPPRAAAATVAIVAAAAPARAAAKARPCRRRQRRRSNGRRSTAAGSGGLCSVCDDNHAAGTISIAFCRTSSTTGPTS